MTEEDKKQKAHDNKKEAAVVQAPAEAKGPSGQEQPEKKNAAQAPAGAKPQAQGEPAVKKKKKINRLTLPEVEKKLQQVQEKMKGLGSSFAQQLLKRKEQLLQRPESKVQKPEAAEQNKEKVENAGGESAENT